MVKTSKFILTLILRWRFSCRDVYREQMLPGVQSRDDTRVPDGHVERDLDCISAGELSSAFGLPRWIGIELLCR